MVAGADGAAVAKHIPSAMANAAKHRITRDMTLPGRPAQGIAYTFELDFVELT